MTIAAAHSAPSALGPAGSTATYTPPDPEWPALRRKARPEASDCHMRSALTLRGGVTTVGTIVSFVDRHVCSVHGAIALGPVTLLATELGMHAVRRLTRTSELTAECHVDRIDLLVEIPGVRVASFGPRARNPLGLAPIGRIADDWGIEPQGRGVRIWASVDARPGRHLSTVR